MIATAVGRRAVGLASFPHNPPVVYQKLGVELKAVKEGHLCEMVAGASAIKALR